MGPITVVMGKLVELQQQAVDGRLASMGPITVVMGKHGDRPRTALLDDQLQWGPSPS